jgi:hypothetical protein
LVLSTHRGLSGAATLLESPHDLGGRRLICRTTRTG